VVLRTSAPGRLNKAARFCLWHIIHTGVMGFARSRSIARYTFPVQ